MTEPHNAYVRAGDIHSPTNTPLIGCSSPSRLNHMLRKILSNLISAVKRWRVRLLGDGCRERIISLEWMHSPSRSPVHFFHHGFVMWLRRMTDFCPLSSSQHPLRGNHCLNISNWIFVPHYMSDGGTAVGRCAHVTSFERVYFNQYHLFLPFTHVELH